VSFVRTALQRAAAHSSIGKESERALIVCASVEGILSTSEGERERVL
jgi:hypothetical protein